MTYTKEQVSAAIFLLRRPADGSGVNRAARQTAKDVLRITAAELQAFAKKNPRTEAAKAGRRSARTYLSMAAAAE